MAIAVRSISVVGRLGAVRRVPRRVSAVHTSLVGSDGGANAPQASARITLRDQDCLGTCTVSTHKTEPDQHHGSETSISSANRGRPDASSIADRDRPLASAVDAAIANAVAASTSSTSSRP